MPIDDHLAPLVEAVERGEEVIITRNGEEVATVRPSGRAAGGASTPKVIDDAFIAQMVATQERIQALGIPPADAAKLIREMRDEGY